MSDADLLLHVVDGSHPDPEGQISAVRGVLSDVGAADVKEVVVINKADAADPEIIDRLIRHERHSIVVSSADRPGPRRAARPHGELPQPGSEIKAVIPYDRGDLVSRLHQESEVITTEHREDGTFVHAKVHPPLLGELEAYLV